MTVVTVLGEIPERDLGAVMAHEHLCCDFSIRGGNPDNRMLDWQLIAREVGFFKKAGGGAVFEVTPFEMGSNPAALKKISDASGVHIIHGIGFYQEDCYPDWVRSATADGIADFFVRRIEEDHNGVRSGIIGEIGSHNEEIPDPGSYRLRDGEAKVFRAAALAQQRTGVSITTHASLGRGGHAQLDVLEQAGANLSRVVIGHCDAHGQEGTDADLAYFLPILDRGACVQFDLIGWNKEWPGIMTDEIRADRLTLLIRRGYGHRLLLSSDTCRLSQLHLHEGRGYDYLFTQFLPMLRSRGVSDLEIEALTIDNPQGIASLSQTR